MSEEKLPSWFEIHQGLLTAVEAGRVDVIQNIWRQYPDYSDKISQIDFIELQVWKETALARAIRCHQVDAMRSLLSLGACYDRLQYTPQEDTLSLYTYTQKVGTDACVSVWHAFLMQQVTCDEVQHVVSLLKLGINPNLICDPAGNTLLHWAATCGAVNVLENVFSKVYANQMDWNALNEQGATALHEALHHNHINCISSLVENGVDVYLISGKTGYCADKTARDLILDMEENEEISEMLKRRENKVKDEKDVSKWKRRVEEKDILIIELQNSIQQLVKTQEDDQCFKERRHQIEEENKTLRQENGELKKQMHVQQKVVIEMHATMKEKKEDTFFLQSIATWLWPLEEKTLLEKERLNYIV